MADTDNSKICAVLVYLVAGLIWWAVDEKLKKNDFVKFHVKQFLVLLIVGVIWSIAYSILYFILSIVTFGIFAMIGWIGYYLPLVWTIQGIVYSAQGQKKELWLIGQYAKKFTF